MPITRPARRLQRRLVLLVAVLWIAIRPGIDAIAADSPTPAGKSLPARNATKQSVANERASTDAGNVDSGSMEVYNCEGRNGETYARVYGTCQNGTFSGPNDTTGNIAYGRCVAGGSFEATDTTTAQKVTGRCDAKPRPTSLQAPRSGPAGASRSAPRSAPRTAPASTPGK